MSFRRGDAESAVKYITKSEQLQPVDFTHAMNLSVLALAQQQLNRPEKARKALDEVKQLISQLRADEMKKHSHDLRIAEILHCEAEALINGRPNPKPSAPTQP